METENDLTPVIAVRGVTRTFGDVTALDNVSFQIARNGICGLLGSNGAGKTTLMGIIAGHDRGDQGSVEVLGRKPFESAEVAAATSFIRDNQRYPDSYKLIHVLNIAGAFHTNWDGKLAEKLAKEFRIPVTTQIAKFSRGQQSALSIVIALASRAPITIFDEPYLGLDVASRQRFYELLMTDYARHPRTIIVSTHLVGEMEQMFDQAIILEEGKLVLDSPVDQLDLLAHRVSGRAEQVAAYSAGKKVLSTRNLGAMAMSVIQEPAMGQDVAGLESLVLEPVSLEDLVGAFGSQPQLIMSGE